MSQETLILKLAQSYLQARKAQAIASAKRTALRWGLFYFALLFLFCAFVGACLTAYLWLKPQLGRIYAASIVTTSIGLLGIFCIFLGKILGRTPREKTLSPELSEICSQVCKDLNIEEALSKHGLKIVMTLFIVGILAGRSKGK